MSKLLAKEGTALLRDLMQGYFDRCAERERRVEVVGADGIERRDARTSSRRIETPVGEIEVKPRRRGAREVVVRVEIAMSGY